MKGEYGSFGSLAVSIATAENKLLWLLAARLLLRDSGQRECVCVEDYIE